MKTCFSFNCNLLLLLMILLFTECKKEKKKLNVTLHGKSIKEVRSYIQGKWRVHYLKGGVCSTCIFDREQYNESYEFFPNDRVKYIFRGVLLADTTLSWTKEKPPVYPDSVLIMEFYDNRSSSNFFEAGEIYNDTLILYNPDKFNPDRVTFHLTKIN